jgi:serine/threonine protein kinase
VSTVEAGAEDGAHAEKVATKSEAPPQEAFGRYALLEKIGHGGMAEVFRAKSYGVEGFEKVLVIKRILAKLASDPRFVEMFVREAKLSVRLSHANVVQVFDLGRVGDALFIAMEYVQGVDLATLLARIRRRGSQVAFSTAAYVAAEVAKGLDHAHRRRDEQLRPLGIVHRDVSPQNVLLSYEGEVKVTDFGIAKALGDPDISPLEEDEPRTDGKIAIRGKFAYLSPEQANGQPVDARSDIWALGVVLYEMLAGSNPFAAPTVFETLRRVRSAEAPPLALARPDAPKELVAIVAKALALAPADRYADAARMHDELLAYLYTSGERFGAHALSELLVELRETRDSGQRAALDLGGEAFAEEGLVRTPVEVPDAADLSTAPPPRAASSGAMNAAAVDPSAGGFARARSLGEHREVSALIVELGGSSETSMDESSDPGRALAHAESIARRYGAEIVDSDPGRIGAVFGAKRPDGRDTDIAVRCAIVIGRMLADFAPQSGIGVHSARVVVDAEGNLVHDERYVALLGAARELARAKEGRIALSTNALRHVRASFEVEAVPEVSRGLATVSGVLLKGRKTTSELYGRFVGRREELRVLGELLAAATRRRARLVTIRGEAGIGKTRLLHEVHRRLQRGAYNVGWYMATCAPHGRDVPLAGVAAMLRVLCGIEEGDDASKVSAVRPRLRALGLGDDELASVLELVRARGDAGYGDATKAQSHAAAALAHMISRLCDDRLHVLAWDDVQLMDAVSAGVLASVSKAVASCRVVLLFAGTGEESLSATTSAAAAAQQVQQNVIMLGDLPREDLYRLTASRLGAREVDEDLLQFVAERTGGNPLYVEELVRAMSESGAVDRRIESESSGKPVERALLRVGAASVDLPKSLRGLMTSRLAKLSPQDRTVLATIALLGEPADIDLLAACANERVSDIERIVFALEGASILRRSGARSIAFVSPVAREVVLDATPNEAKREIHASIATAMLAAPDPSYGRIAHHQLECGDRERAATSFGRSAESLLAAGKPEGAAHDATRALSVADLRARPRTEIARWLATLASALESARGGGRNSGPEVVAAVERARARIEGDRDASLVATASVDEGRALASVSQFDGARAAFERAERQAGSDPDLLRAILVARVGAARKSGDFNESARLLELLEPMVEAGNDVRQRFDVLLALAQSTAAMQAEQGLARAMSHLERAEALIPQLPNPQLRRVEVGKARGLTLVFGRNLPAAASACQESAELARSLGLSMELAINLHNLGDVRAHLRENGAAYAALAQSLALCEEGGNERMATSNRISLLYLDARNGDRSAAQRLSDLAVSAKERNWPWDELSSRYWLGLIARDAGDKARALADLGRARQLAEKLGMRGAVADCDEALGALTGEA